MDRRRYLVAMGASSIGTIAGCVAPPRAEDPDTAGTTDGDDGPGDGDDDPYDGSDENNAYVAGDHVELELMDRFVLEESGIAIVVTDTERLEPADLGIELGGEDAFAVRMTVIDEGGGGATLDHDLFWLEGLDPDDSGPDPAISERLADGVSGDRTQLASEEETELRIGFAIPPDLEPAYLWARQYYVCLI